jgi:hypothetical protein
MNPAEVVVSDVKRLHGLMVDPLFAERVRQARIAPVAHADRQILPFHMAGADAGAVGITQDWDYLRANDIGRAIPALAFRIARIDLDKLRESAVPGLEFNRNS